MSDDGRQLVSSGPRVALARFREGDLDAIHAFASDPEVCRFTSWGPNHLEDTRAFLAAALQPEDGALRLAVLLDVLVIGCAAVWTTSVEDRAGELGYVLHRDHWGRGLATEVAGLLVRLGTERLGLERIVATCAPDNIGSVRVLEKAGFRREGLLRGHVRVRGRRRDSLLLARLSTDRPPA